MRLAAIVLPTLFSLCISVQGFTPQNSLFYDGTFDQLRKDAFQEAKPYILYFSFPGHSDSRAFELLTFQDPTLIKLLRQRFFIFKIEEDWEHNSDKYPEVHFDLTEPGLMVFNEYSDQVLEIRSYMDAEDLVPELHKILPKRGAENLEEPASTTSVRRLDDSFFPESNHSDGQAEEVGVEGAVPYDQEATDALIIIDELAEENSEVSQDQLDTEKSNFKRRDPFEQSTQESEDPILEKEFDFEQESEIEQDLYPGANTPQQRKYLPLVEQSWEEKDETRNIKLSSSHTPSQQKLAFEGYGIQTGAFEQSFFMRSQVDYLKHHFSHDVFVNKATENGKTMYKVQVGPFKTEAEARAFQKEYRRISGKAGGFLVYLR